MGMTYNMHGYMRNACTTLVENLKRLVGRHVCRSEVNITRGLKEARWIQVARGTVRCCAVVSAVMNLLGDIRGAKLIYQLCVSIAFGHEGFLPSPSFTAILFKLCNSYNTESFPVWRNLRHTRIELLCADLVVRCKVQKKIVWSWEQ
jgi:hypothetical protein